ncbi:MAG: OmpH family outer membrane protein, partial [Pirellulales bacterium]|nr:OmpH family outer membrane protein [Pirellulales bacterium]
VGHILEESSRIKAAKETLKAEMQQADGQLVQKQETIRKKQEQLRQFQPGSREYKELEAEIAQDISNLKVEATLKRKEFGERQSQFLYNAYKEIEQEVQSLAAERGFVMVLRISRAEVPQENLEAVYAYAGKNVVWSDGRYDITNEILSRLERRAGYGANPNMGSRPTIPMQPRR